MPLYGTLTSMPLPDLLQWLCNAKVTGTLQIERDRVSKSIHIADGMVVGCSSDAPQQRLGHFLLSRGKITEDQLREALQLQEISGQHLGMLLVELNALPADELSAHLEAQAEDTIFSLFDWDDAVFRFQENENDPANVFPVSLRVEDVLLRGLKRYDEMREIRTVFNDPGIVLRKTAKSPPAAVLENRMGRALWDLVNGERTVAETLLQTHGSEYAVTKFLFELHRAGLVEILEVRSLPDVPPPPAESVEPVAPDPSEASVNEVKAETEAGEEILLVAPPVPQDRPEMATQPAPTAEAAEIPEITAVTAVAETQPAAPASAAQTPTAELEVAPPAEESMSEAVEDLLADVDTNIDLPATQPQEVEATATPEAPAQEAPGSAIESLEHSDAHNLDHNLEKARQLMSEAKFELALDVLDRLYREFPGEEALRRLTAEAEAAFVEKAYRHYLPPSKVLFLKVEMDDLETEDLSPSEFFLLSRIDGTWDIKSIIQIAPLRESDALRTLKRMRENGLIELRDPV